MLSPPRAVHLAVADRPLALALHYVLRESGFGRARDEASADDIVGDLGALVPGGRPVDVLVVPAVPAACQRAIDAIAGGRARSAVFAEEPDRVVDALDAVSARSVYFPGRLVDEAQRAPRLEPRLATTLRLVLAGHTNGTISAQLRVSEATAKRQVTELLRRFGVPNRSALCAAAHEAGFAVRS